MLSIKKDSFSNSREYFQKLDPLFYSLLIIPLIIEGIGYVKYYDIKRYIATPLIGIKDETFYILVLLVAVYCFVVNRMFRKALKSKVLVINSLKERMVIYYNILIIKEVKC